MYIQGRLNGVDITIRISQIGIICIHSWLRVRHTQLGKSLIYSKNSRGPNIVPWRIPHLRVQHSEKEPLTMHF